MNAPNMERDFKGVWIPKEIWLDDRLSAIEKVILVEIDSLDNGDEHCWISNENLAQFCQCSSTKVSNAVSKLLKLGYIKVHSFDGRTRKLQSCLAFSVMQPYKICKADSQKVQANNIYNNIYIPPYNPPKGEVTDLLGFDIFWKAYPNKKVKTTAVKAWKKLKPDESLLQIILSDVERRKAGEWKGKDKQYIPHPATYINQRRWEDEPDTGTVEPEYRPTIQELINQRMEENGGEYLVPGYDIPLEE